MDNDDSNEEHDVVDDEQGVEGGKKNNSDCSLHTLNPARAAQRFEIFKF
jgi:hypothetical protein